MKHYILFISLLTCLWGGVAAQQFRATLKPVAGNPAAVEVWLKPDFTNTSQYLFQIGLPVALPASVSPQAVQVTLHPDFVASFGSNYPLTINPVASSTDGTERYFNILLVRGGAGASVPQYWKKDSAFVVLTLTFTLTGAPGAAVKLADYQDGGSDAQGMFYTQSGTGLYYISSTNSADNFYSTPGFSTAGGTAAAGFVQTDAPVSSRCDRPVAVVGNVGVTTADISWPSTDAAGYEYAVTTSATPPASGASTTAATHRATGLLANTVYYAHVRSSCTGGAFSLWATVSFTTQNLNCAAPAAATPTEVRATGATLSWAAVTGATGYEYAFSTSGTPPASGTATTDLTVTDNTLTPGTAHTFYLRTSCAGGTFSSWVSVPFITECVGPALPVVGGVTAEDAMFTWPAVPGAAGYQYALTSGATPPFVGEETVATTYAASGLNGGTTYYFHVRTVCAAANTFSGWTTTPVTTNCPEVPSLAVSAITPSSATVSWTQVPGAVGYEYAQVASPTAPSEAGTFTAETQAGLTALTPGQTYYVFVRTACAGGLFSPWGLVSFATQGLSCPPPTPPVIGTLTGQVVVFSWSLSAGTVGAEYAVTTEATPPAEGTTATGTTASVTTLTGNTAYYAHVRAKCGEGNFSAWSTTSFKTLCGNPSGLIISGVTASGATAAFTIPGGAAGYEYVVSTSAATPLGATVGTAGTATPLVLTGLTGGTRYYVHLRTSCGGGVVSGWVTASWETICQAPVVTASVEAFTARVLWASISGGRRYEQALSTYNTPPMAGAVTGDTVLSFAHLAEAAGYYFHVRTYCMSGLYSSWTTVSFQTPGLNAYPNPVRGSLRVNLFGVQPSAGGELRLYDAVGRLVRVQAMTAGSTTVELQSLSAGMYLLKYSDGRVKYTTKVLKQ